MSEEDFTYRPPALTVYQVYGKTAEAMGKFLKPGQRFIDFRPVRESDKWMSMGGDVFNGLDKSPPYPSPRLIVEETPKPKKLRFLLESDPDEEPRVLTIGEIVWNDAFGIQTRLTQTEYRSARAGDTGALNSPNVGEGGCSMQWLAVATGVG